MQLLTLAEKNVMDSLHLFLANLANRDALYKPRNRDVPNMVIFRSRPLYPHYPQETRASVALRIQGDTKIEITSRREENLSCGMCGIPTELDPFEKGWQLIHFS